jgi:hypothetical protein
MEVRESEIESEPESEIESEPESEIESETEPELESESEEGFHRTIFKIVSERCDASQKNFTEDARDVLTRAVITYAEDVFREAGKVRRKRKERIAAIDERLGVLRAETGRLEEERRTLKHACRTGMKRQCLREVIKRVEEKGHPKEGKRTIDVCNYMVR